MVQIQNDGGFLTFDDSGAQRCLGYLMHFNGHGVYEPSLGRVDVTPEQAEVHNKLLDEAVLKGLDESCEVGQGTSFYLQATDSKGRPACGQAVVKTFIGTVVSADVRMVGKSVTFNRKGKVFRGRTQKDADLVNFRRVK